MSGKRYPEVFKIEAVKQVVDRGHSVSRAESRLDINTHSLYARIKKYGQNSSANNEQSDVQNEIRRLQKELKRVTDKRDKLKKAAAYSAKLYDWGMPLSVKMSFAGLFVCSAGCWVLIPVASTAVLTAPSAGPETDRTDKTVLAGIGMRLWL